MWIILNFVDYCFGYAGQSRNREMASSWTAIIVEMEQNRMHIAERRSRKRARESVTCIVKQACF